MNINTQPVPAQAKNGHCLLAIIKGPYGSGWWGRAQTPAEALRLAVRSVDGEPGYFDFSELTELRGQVFHLPDSNISWDDLGISVEGERMRWDEPESSAFVVAFPSGNVIREMELTPDGWE